MLVRESRIVARLLLGDLDRDAVRDRVLRENLFQNSSPETTRKYCRLILPRLEQLSSDMLRFVAEGNEELVRLTLLVAVVRTVDLVADFIEDVLITKVRGFEPELSRVDWSRFLEERATVDPAVSDWSESSRKKMGQVVFRMLAEAGYLGSTRTMRIVYPAIPFELVDALEASGDQRALKILRLGR